MTQGFAQRASRKSLNFRGIQFVGSVLAQYRIKPSFLSNELLERERSISLKNCLSCLQVLEFKYAENKMIIAKTLTRIYYRNVINLCLLYLIKKGFPRFTKEDENIMIGSDKSEITPDDKKLSYPSYSDFYSGLIWVVIFCLLLKNN